MKIAVTTTGNDLEARVDARFGRAPQFLIYDTQSRAFYIKDNEQNLNASQGAGIQSAMNLAAETVDCVITGNCGPKAYATLGAAGIAVYTCKDSTVAEVIQRLQNGELTASTGANVASHWS